MVCAGEHLKAHLLSTLLLWAGSAPTCLVAQSPSIFLFFFQKQKQKQNTKSQTHTGKQEQQKLANTTLKQLELKI